jgi:hypothetical protein
MDDGDEIDNEGTRNERRGTRENKDRRERERYLVT